MLDAPIDVSPPPAQDALGRVEYVVESRHNGGHSKWLVMRADTACVPAYAALGLSITPGSRVVIEAESKRPVGVLESPPPQQPNYPAGYNPYWDLPAA